MVKSALIVGAGSGISASFARQLARAGARIALASREPARHAAVAKETGAVPIAADASKPGDVIRMFDAADKALGAIDVVLFNPSFRTRGPITDLVPEDVERALMVGAYGGFLVGQQAARRMLSQGSGAIFFTGASASVKGYAQSAPFAMAKFALRGLAQSMARELAPKGIHVAHFVIDGGVRSQSRPDPAQAPDSTLDPDDIATTYMHVLSQHRSAWTWEVELRPWQETF